MRPYDQDGESHLARKEREAKEAEVARRRAEYAEIELRRACIAVAKTPEGRLILRDLADDESAVRAVRDAQGKATDYIMIGHARSASFLRERLKEILPRDLYLEIIYPKEEKENA